MSQENKLSRRSFLQLVGVTASGAVLAACVAPVAPAGSTGAGSQAAAATSSARKVKIAVGGWAEQGTKDLLQKTGFTEKSGIDVEVMLRTDTKRRNLPGWQAL